MKSEIKPYAIISNDGTIMSILQTNEKGYKKSIENKQIWAVSADTERLLPIDDLGPVTAFREKDGWYEAVVKDDSGKTAAAKKQDCEASSDKPASATGAGSEIIERLFRVIEQRKIDMPEGSYTTHLFNSGMSKIKKKTGEEAVELLLAEDRDEIIYEASDLIYHMLVLLSAAEINPAEIFFELESRE